MQGFLRALLESLAVAVVFAGVGALAGAIAPFWGAAAGAWMSWALTGAAIGGGGTFAWNLIAASKGEGGGGGSSSSPSVADNNRPGAVANKSNGNNLDLSNNIAPKSDEQNPVATSSETPISGNGSNPYSVTLENKNSPDNNAVVLEEKEKDKKEEKEKDTKSSSIDPASEVMLEPKEEKPSEAVKPKSYKPHSSSGIRKHKRISPLTKMR